MKRKVTIADALMAEVILYGGLPARRADVYAHALATLRTYIGTDNGRRPVTEEDARRGAEQFAFGFNTRLAPVGAVPLTLDELNKLDDRRGVPQAR